MRERKIIKLDKPLVTHEGTVNEIIIQEPTFDEFMAFGDPWTWAQGSEGTPFAVENTEVIKQYLAVCLVQPNDPALLTQSTARVARDVKEKLLSFFRVSGEDKEGSETSPTTSSSGASASAQTGSSG